MEGKRLREAKKAIDREKLYPLEQAVKLVKERAKAKFDETIEILTWRQLKLHTKPILICDVAGSSAPLIAMIEAAIAAGFARSDARELFEVVAGVPEAMERLRYLATIRGGATALL